MRRIYLNARLLCAAILLGLIFATQSSAQSPKPKLAKIAKTTTLVIINNTGPVPYGISEARLRTLLELRLRTAGLRVLTEDEDAGDPETNPYVMLYVSTLEISNQSGRQTGFAYRVDLSVRISDYVLLNGSRAPLELWADGNMGVGPRDDTGSTIEKMVGDLCDSLLNQWLKDNPKR